MKALALNAGSSTLKAALYDVEPGTALAEPPDSCWQSQVDWDPAESAAAGEAMLRQLCEGSDAPLRSPAELEVVGHRIVHGGARFIHPTQITAEVKEAVASLSVSAPLHNAAGLGGVAVAERFAGDGAAHVGVFDTAFHAALPAAAYAYAGPYQWLEQGLRRFGFHGINHEYVAHRAARLMGRDLDELRLITCHLGSGCSLAAVRNGRSVDTTMGFTPLDGLVMGTRSGTLDPGLVLHLLREPGASVDDIDKLLNKRSGLLGLSGCSGDLRAVLAAREQGDARASLAVDVYIHQLSAHIGAMLGALDGLDAVVFTAGVGEHSPEVRARALRPLAFLGIELDPARNRGPDPDADIAAETSPVRVLVIRALEEWAIARAAAVLTDGTVAH
ncbi:MAG: acetate/propionate family kinase [Actinomycetota bacterium]|nr:acetate/propionate family kinase [Actinomycetota bacterium]